MSNDPVSDGNQLHGSELYLDSVEDAILRLQEDGGIGPEIVHRPSCQVQPPASLIKRRRVRLET